MYISFKVKQLKHSNFLSWRKRFKLIKLIQNGHAQLTLKNICCVKQMVLQCVTYRSSVDWWISQPQNSIFFWRFCSLRLIELFLLCSLTWIQRFQRHWEEGVAWLPVQGEEERGSWLALEPRACSMPETKAGKPLVSLSVPCTWHNTIHDSKTYLILYHLVQDALKGPSMSRTYECTLLWAFHQLTCLK